jgi:type IV pilus assembly protein PilB
MAFSRRKLGELLLAAGVLDEEHLKAALAEQKRWGGKLGRTLIDLGYVREDIMVKALSHQLKLPSVNLSRTPPDKEAISLVPVQLCERYGVFPVSYDLEHKSLALATSDPTNESALRELRLELNIREIKPMVAGTVDIDRAVRRHYWGESIEASATATPQQLGLSERVINPFDLQPPRSTPAPMPIPARPSTPVAPPPPVNPSSAVTVTPTMSSTSSTSIPRQTLPGVPTPFTLQQQPPVVGPTVPPRPMPNRSTGETQLPRRTETDPESVYTAAIRIAAPKGVPPGQTPNDQMVASLQRLEKLLTAEVRSLRTLVELLVEKGIINRDEYLKRVKAK